MRLVPACYDLPVRRMLLAVCGCVVTPVMASGADWDPWTSTECPVVPEAVEPATSAGVVFGLAAIRVYQLFLSPALGGRCQFTPSCSRYTFTCIASHGLIVGMWAGADRISRCHGFAATGGYPEQDDGRLEDPPGR